MFIVPSFSQVISLAPSGEKAALADSFAIINIQLYDKIRSLNVGYQTLTL